MKRFVLIVCVIFLNSLFIVLDCRASDTISPEQIQRLFPKATVIGNKAEDFPVYPVYQLQELLGYAFESNDLVEFPGFSGDRINLLIGMDVQGNIVGIEVLHHHEPIFLHGLGPEPMNRFIDQYIGQNVSKRVIVDSAANDTNPNDNTVHVDGVTKATVSVIVISDTVLLSALQVARNKLTGFASAPAATAKADTFEPLDTNDLIARGLLQHWEISQNTFESELGASLDDYPDGTFYLQDGDTFNVYFAYLNSPLIGKNLLGEADFTRLQAMLKSNEQAFMVMSSGFFSYLEPEFKPGTVPTRVSLLQNDLPFGMRDLNFYSFEPQQLAGGLEATSNLQIFAVNTQSGFNPSLPMQLSLNIDIAKNHLISQQLQLTHTYAVPTDLFDIAAPVDEYTPEPAWIRVWKMRWPVITVLVLSLIAVTAIFALQHKLSANENRFRWVRWSFMFYTLIFIGWYAQGQLSVVNIYPILQSVKSGFDLQVYLMDPVLFILWSYVFVSLFIVGRGIFCGWLCPFGALQEMVGWVAKKFRIRQRKIPFSVHRKLGWIKYAILGGLVIVSYLSLSDAEVLSEVEPFKTAITLHFVRYWPFVLYTVALLAAGLFINKFYCRYVCPLGAGLAILGYFHKFEWLTRRKECGKPCTMCYHKCDIKAITPQGKVDYNECVQCLECIVYYNNDHLCPPLKKAGKSPRTAQNIAESLAVEVR
ncbi:4Fe-4S binding protein [Alteromonas sp. AMM-1]|uniref:4Fe-4S binding protein n=1 Tax=Alteromonas sp. AMM-1 TaxID=3394233 RepID=UPI0039A52AF9